MYKDLNKQIGSKVKQARKKSNITQEQLAEKIGLSTQFLSDVETGRSGMSFETLLSICDTLNVTPNFILDKNVKKNISPVLEDTLENFPSQLIPYAEKILSSLLEVYNDNSN